MKKIILPLLAFIALPTTIQANVDPKVAEMCMKATDFQGCMKSFSGLSERESNITINTDYDKALTLLESGDTSGAIENINRYLKKNNQSKEAYLLRAVIYGWELDSADNAIKDLNKAIEIDDEYADAYAVRGVTLYWDFSNGPAAKKDLEKALEISPNNPYILYSYAEYLYDNSFNLADKNKKDLAINSTNEAIKYFRKSISSQEKRNDNLVKRIFPFGIEYDSYAQIGGAKFDLYFWYKDTQQRQLAREAIKSSVLDYSKSIELAPSQEETDKFEIERNFDFIDLGELHFWRGNAYSWFDRTGKKACKDWEISKKYGNKDAQKNAREWRC